MGSAEEFGPYVVHERIGLGGMATVHRAETKGIAGFTKQIALKRMLPSVATNASLVQSFIREARLASHLRHGNVAQTYDLGKVGDVYFIAMEFVPGHNLREILRHCATVAGHMPLPIAMNIVNQICDALDYAHNLCDETGQPLGIIHRDVSPANVIVSEGGVVKLIDFGIAKASNQGSSTLSGTVKGKFAYMAPEYLMGFIDARADLFALGVIAHELLTNRPLFQGKDDMDTLYRVKDMPITPPSQINPAVPPEIDAIILTALDRDPEQRWQRASALRSALTSETKKLGLVAHNAQVIEWIERAFQQFDGDSSPEIAMSGGTSELSVSAPVTAGSGHDRPLESDPGDDDDFDPLEASDSMETILRPVSDGTDPLMPIPPQLGGSKPKAPLDTFDVPTSNDRGGRPRVATPSSGVATPSARVATPSSGVATTGVRVATPIPGGSFELTLDESQPDARAAARDAFELTGQARDSFSVPTTNDRPPPRPSHETFEVPTKAAGAAYPEMARNSALEMNFDAETITAGEAYSTSDLVKSTARPDGFDTPTTPSRPASPVHPGLQAPTMIGASQTPRAGAPAQAPTMIGALQTPPSGAPAQAPMAVATASPQARTMFAASAPVQAALSGLASPLGQPVAPAGFTLESPSAISRANKSDTDVRTDVAVRQGRSSNLLLAVLVLIVAGGATAVVYFALPYLT